MESVRIHKKWLSAVIVVALAGCYAPAEDADQAPAVDLAAEAAAVEAVSMQWLAATQARDLNAATALFAEDAVFFDQGEGSIEGLEAIRADIESSWAENPDFALSWSTSSVEVASSGDMAWEHGSWVYDVDGAGEAVEMTGEYITVYRKIDGAWKAVADMGVTHETMEDDEEM